MSYEIGLPEFEIINRQENANGAYIYTVKAYKNRVCPACGGTKCVIHKANNRQVRDLNEYGHHVSLLILSNRYQCKECGSTFATEYDSIDKSARITNRLREKVQQESLEKPFKQVANEYGITISTVKRAFESFVEEMEQQRVGFKLF